MLDARSLGLQKNSRLECVKSNLIFGTKVLELFPRGEKTTYCSLSSQKSSLVPRTLFRHSVVYTWTSISPRKHDWLVIQAKDVQTLLIIAKGSGRVLFCKEST